MVALAPFKAECTRGCNVGSWVGKHSATTPLNPKLSTTSIPKLPCKLPVYRGCCLVVLLWEHQVHVRNVEDTITETWKCMAEIACKTPRSYIEWKLSFSGCSRPLTVNNWHIDNTCNRDYQSKHFRSDNWNCIPPCRSIISKRSHFDFYSFSKLHNLISNFWMTLMARWFLLQFEELCSNP